MVRETFGQGAASVSTKMSLDSGKLNKADEAPVKKKTKNNKNKKNN